MTGLDPQPVVDIVSAVAYPTSRPPSRKLAEEAADGTVRPRAWSSGWP